MLLKWTIGLVVVGGTSFIVWMGLFHLFRRLLMHHCISQKRDMPYRHILNNCEAAICILQSVVTSICGIIIVTSCRHDVMWATHSLSSWYAFVLMSYFVYDLIAMYEAHTASLAQVPNSFVSCLISYMKKRPLLIAHHVVIVLVLFPVLVYRDGVGDFFVGCFYCVEFTGPCTNMRIILSRFGLKDSKWYLWNGIAMIVSWVVCRVLVFPYMYVTYGNTYGLNVFEVINKIPLHCNIGSLLILLPQIHWVRLMILGAVKLSRGKALSDSDEKID